MIKFTATTPQGRTILGFGLSYKNLKRLKQGLPIKVNVEEMGFLMPIDLVIYAGKDERAMTAQLVEAGVITQEQVDNAHEHNDEAH